MELTAYVHARVEDPSDFTIFGIKDMSSCGYVLVASAPCVFDVPSRADQILKHIQLLREQQAKIRAEAESNANQLEETIQKFLCIEYKPELNANSI